MSSRMDAIRNRAFIVGIIAVALCLAGAFIDPQQFFRSYLAAFIYWLGFPLGSLALLMLHHLVGGRWGFMIQRLLEAAVRTFPVTAVLFLPLLGGMRWLYPWAQAAADADPVLKGKSSYLNPAFFTARALIYFAVWIGCGYALAKWSRDQDRAGVSLIGRLQSLSGPGLALYGITVTFSAIDWIMSLEPDWYSTIYGMIFMVGHGLAALALTIIAARMLADEPPLSEVAAPERFHDLGNLLLALVMFWAYLAFSQFLIIWSENLSEEIPWYVRRTAGGWRTFALILVIFQFALPFLLLLSRAAKRHARFLALIALLVLAMHWADILWLVAPAFHPNGFYVHWLDVVTLAALGGIWIAAFLYFLAASALLPHDPRFIEAVSEAEAT
ncbi:MAG TPA: hypothetical protein VL754_00400 [Verrucomicrobiae bacterium]|jgi:hypothetical protein|nr:hypothetical protein [Verrucomicrobiae bacterium]